MTTFPQTFRTDAPGNGADPTETPLFDREAKAGVQQRADVDHYWEASGANTYDDSDTGEHRKMTIRTLSVVEVAALASAKAYLYRLVTDGELYFKDASDNTIQLTVGGIVKLTSAALLGVLANNAYFTAVDNAGTGTADLIKLDASDNPVLKDGVETSTDAAPTASKGVVNRKYAFDMMLPVATALRVGYTGGESVTFPNGLIHKMGRETSPTGNTTVTFGVAFPNAIVSIQQTIERDIDGNPNAIQVRSYSTSSFVMRNNSQSDIAAVHWLAIGW